MVYLCRFSTLAPSSIYVVWYPDLPRCIVLRLTLAGRGSASVGSATSRMPWMRLWPTFSVLRCCTLIPFVLPSYLQTCCIVLHDGGDVLASSAGVDAKHQVNEQIRHSTAGYLIRYR